LFPHKSGGFITRDARRRRTALLRQLNQPRHAARGRRTLDARIRSYELAARMQLSAPKALDLAREPDYILDLYGIDRTTKVWPKEINASEEMDLLGRQMSDRPAPARTRRALRANLVGNDNSFPRRNWIHTRTSSAITDHWRRGHGAWGDSVDP